MDRLPSPPCNKVIFNASLSLKHVLLAHQPCRQGPFCQLKLQTGRHFIMESFLIEKDQNSLLSKKVLGLDSCVNKGQVRQIGYFSWSATEEMVFCYQNCLTYCEKKCSSDPEFFLKFRTEGREFAKYLRLLEQFIKTVKGQNNFW